MQMSGTLERLIICSQVFALLISSCHNQFHRLWHWFYIGNTFMKSFFITGTDTNCGKTYVMCKLLAYLTKKNFKAMGLKPVATGCFLKEGNLYNEDELQIQAANPDMNPVSFMKFSPPISPHLAARAANQPIILKDIAEFCKKKHQESLDYLLIEGAGGLMAPLNERETWLDFIHLTNIPIILVVGVRLGCLNHALLTTAVIENQNLPFAGWVANCLDPDMLALEENIQTLKDKISQPFIARIPYQGFFESDTMFYT